MIHNPIFWHFGILTCWHFGIWYFQLSYQLIKPMIKFATRLSTYQLINPMIKSGLREGLDGLMSARQMVMAAVTEDGIVLEVVSEEFYFYLKLQF